MRSHQHFNTMKRSLKQLLSICALVTAFCLFLHGNEYETRPANEVIRTKSPNTKVILMWTTWFGQKPWFGLSRSRLGGAMFRSEHCTHTDCELTDDTRRLSEADVLLFHHRDPPNWPLARYSRQYYGHVVHEPPGGRASITYLDKFEGRINLTMNYRLDADLYLPYAKLRPIRQRAEYIPRIRLADKSGMVVWPVSHCRTLSKREQYVAELSKHIDVDVYGRCGTKHCPRSNTTACLQWWERNYKFYLAFENNVCQDYITEKLFQPLKHEIIPVVLGGGNYTRDAPPGSFIDVRDFPSPKALADFLLDLAANETRYYSYFWWKGKYEEISMPEWFMCRLCEALHNNEFGYRPAYTHYADYWYGVHGEKCDNTLVSRIRRRGRW